MIAKVERTQSRLLRNLTRTKQKKLKIEYDQKIPQSSTADKAMAPRGRATQQALDTMKTK